VASRDQLRRARTKAVPATTPSSRRIAKLELDIPGRTVSIGGAPIDLSATEWVHC
jgi:DNA-binding response OmpR family regulator